MTSLAPNFAVLVIGRLLYGIGIGLVRNPRKFTTSAITYA